MRDLTVSSRIKQWAEAAEGFQQRRAPFTFILTRDAAANVNIYLNGSSAPIVTQNDPTGVAIATNNMLTLFVDNSVGDSVSAPTDEFSPSGTISAVLFWDSALDSSQIPTAMDVAAVPEPSTWALAITGMTCAAGGVVRRRRAVICGCGS